MALQQEENADDITPDHWIGVLDTSDDCDVIRKKLVVAQLVDAKNMQFYGYKTF